MHGAEVNLKLWRHFITVSARASCAEAKVQPDLFMPVKLLTTHMLWCTALTAGALCARAMPDCALFVGLHCLRGVLSLQNLCC